ncbi:MAG: ribulokinase [Ruminococcaceae bacterium]|nr:ribulokinase [Oscillospiraceae bacterium]
MINKEKNKKKYSVGIDFGTLSCRAAVVDLETGEEKSGVESVYAHGVMTEKLEYGATLGKDYAIQDPRDYIEGLSAIKKAVEAAGIEPNDIVGLGVDFTSSTVLALDEEGMPLSFKEEYKNDPHAYAKLWKHHGAAKETELITKMAVERNESFLSRYGGAVSSEWMIPKILETFNYSPKAYESASRFSEGGDFITRFLTGGDNCSIGGAGFKTFWNEKDGYPSTEYFRSLNEEFGNTVTDKLCHTLTKPCEKAGLLNSRGALITGLPEGLPVASFVLDAHAGMPACGITSSGELLMIMGTSTVLIASCEEYRDIPGICGIVKDGIVPGLYSLETGQSCTGDLYDWVVSNCVTEKYFAEAEERGISIHALLCEKCADKKPGETGLVALDWWNGNRSILQRADVSGMILGMTLETKPEDIYRAALEATAFGSRIVYENLLKNGMEINKITASGGIPQKNPLLMQIYCDVFNAPISVSSVKQPGAYGSALYGAVAGGYFENITEAAKINGRNISRTYYPNEENARTYNELFNEYVLLHDYFGRGANECMRRLREISEKAKKI